MELIEKLGGKSLELTQSHHITSPEAKKLNNIFLDKCQEYKFWEYVRDMPEPTLKFKITGSCKSYLSWQYGEIISQPVLDDKKGTEVVSSKIVACREIAMYCGLTEELALKYFNLDREGYFNEEKEQTDLAFYWYKRAEIDLEDYKHLLKGVE